MPCIRGGRSVGSKIVGACAVWHWCGKMENVCTAGHTRGCGCSGRVATGIGVATGHSCRLVLMLTTSDVEVERQVH